MEVEYVIVYVLENRGGNMDSSGGPYSCSGHGNCIEDIPIEKTVE